MRGGRENCDFRPISRPNSETGQGPRLQLITIRKSYTRFRLGSKSMTLDDLERSLQWTAQLPRCFLCNSWASCLVSYTEKILVGNKWKKPRLLTKIPRNPDDTEKNPRSSGKTQLWQHCLPQSHATVHRSFGVLHPVTGTRQSYSSWYPQCSSSMMLGWKRWIVEYRTRLALCAEEIPLRVEANFDVTRP